MAAEKKGKQATKGTKQIVEENVATLKFYRNMSAGACTAYFLIMFFLSDHFTTTALIMTIISVAIHIGAYQFMAMMSKPQLSESGAVLDSGTDLNMEGGVAEHVKDIIILTSCTQLMTLMSNWFWLVLMLGPIRAVYMLWGSVIQPWLSQKGQEEPQVNEKKQKKMERRMKRVNSR